VPLGQPLWQTHLGVVGSGSGSHLGPFIALLDAKLIIYDCDITSQKFSWAAVSNYPSNWPNFDVFGLYKAGIWGDRHIILDICTLVYLIFLLKI